MVATTRHPHRLASRTGLVLGLLVLLLGQARGIPAQAQAAGEAPEWTSLAPLPEARFEMASAEFEGKLYVFGGFAPGVKASRRVDVYDPEKGSWHRLADLPQAVTHTNTAVAGSAVWLAGGFENTGRGPAVANVWRYDIAADTFSPGPPLPEPRAGGGLAWWDGRLHYMGGLLEDRDTDSGEHWVLEPGAQTGWRRAAAMPAPRNQFGIVVHDGKFFILGGQIHHDSTMGAPQDQTRVDVYDPASDTWRRGPDLPVPLSHMEPGAFVHGGHIFLVGGRGAGGLQAGIWVLAPAEDSWQSSGQLPQPLLAPAARIVGHRLLVAGGATGGLVPQPQVWARPWR